MNCFLADRTASSYLNNKLGSCNRCYFFNPSSVVRVVLAVVLKVSTLLETLKPFRSQIPVFYKIRVFFVTPPTRGNFIIAAVVSLLQVQIHESNKGFQLLAGMGWKLDEGLGARKQGRVNPLQTTFKRDTTGLGAGGKLRPRVTHFPSHIPSQALNAPDGKSDAVRAHESLDHRQGRRSNNSSSRGKRRSHDRGGGSGSGRGGGGFEASSGSERPSNSGVGATFDVAESAAAAAPGSSDVSWGGFWGQGTHPDSGSGRRSGTSTTSRGASSSGRRKGGGGRGVGRGRGTGKDGTRNLMSRKEREAQSEREKRKERRTRFELLSDVPEEYAALFMEERI